MDNAQHPNPAISIPVRTLSSTDSRLPAKYRPLARFVWVIGVAEMVGLTVAGAIPRYNQLIAEARVDHTLLASIGVSGEFFHGIGLRHIGIPSMIAWPPPPAGGKRMTSYFAFRFASFATSCTLM